MDVFIGMLLYKQFVNQVNLQFEICNKLRVFGTHHELIINETITPPVRPPDLYQGCPSALVLERIIYVIPYLSFSQ
jgi:hypothetical protein